MSLTDTPPAGHLLIGRRIAALDRREALARALARHLADGAPVEPDPEYQPRHFPRSPHA